jgi:hypothetical protein
MKRICVFAGSNSGWQTEYLAAAQELGHVLARQEVGLFMVGQPTVEAQNFRGTQIRRFIEEIPRVLLDHHVVSVPKGGCKEPCTVH